MAKAKSKQQALNADTVLADGEELYLRNRTLAAFLAWLVPGAGHFYQRRYFKSTVFSISVFSTFMIGMLVGGGRCVYASWNGTEKRWQYVLQSGLGLAAIPAGIQAYAQRDGGEPPFGDFMRAPQSADDLNEWNREYASGFDMGTLYTMIAGLLNVLVIFDAYAGPLPPPSPKNKRDDPDAPDDDPSSAADGQSADKQGASAGGQN